MNIQVRMSRKLKSPKKETFGQLRLVHSDGHWAGIMKRHEIDLALHYYKTDVRSDGHRAGRGYRITLLIVFTVNLIYLVFDKGCRFSSVGKYLQFN